MKKEEAVVMIRNTMDLLGQSFDQVWKENESLFGRVLTKRKPCKRSSASCRKRRLNAETD